MRMMVCNKCGRELPHTAEFFTRSSRRKSGLTSYCRKCNNTAAKRWREKNSERHIAYMKNYRLNNPAAVMFREWRESGCSRCGFDDIRAIQAHHTDPSEKEATVAFITGVDVLTRELSRCVPLCANCHFIVHDEMRHWEE